MNRAPNALAAHGCDDPHAACVVVAFHRPVALAALLDALEDPALDAVVVNVEADPLVRAVALAAGARVVDVTGNPGYAAAVNRGVEACSGDVVAFMNDDSRIFASDLLLLAAVITRGEADVVVPRVLDGDGQVERTIAAVPRPGALLREWFLLPDRPFVHLQGRLRVEKWRLPARPERIEAASAVLVVTRRELLRAHPMPEEYFLYWEESEWFWRLRALDAFVQYRPDVTAVHIGGRGDVRPEKSRLLARNAVRCIRRTQGRLPALAAILVVILWNLRLVAVDALYAAAAPGPEHRARLVARCAGLRAALTSWTELR